MMRIVSFLIGGIGRIDFQVAIKNAHISLTMTVFAVVFVVAVLQSLVIAESPVSSVSLGGERTVVLLVHGMTWQQKKSVDIWGSRVSDAADSSRWNGMVGFLEDKVGYRFGGTIRAAGPDITLPGCLDTSGARFEAQEANLFSLEFSHSANVDGLAYKAEELCQCVNVLRQFTGAKRVKLVAHSAGGLVSRTLLQSALPRTKYEKGSVDRLITIGTPHLGAAVASSLGGVLGELLGTRATSLQPHADLIVRLNTVLDLPTDVNFAAIVVRGIAADSRGDGEAYKHLVNPDLLARFPLSYREGGDQVVNVQSQNLRLAPCAARYERATGRPVHGVVARVPDPTPLDRSFFEETVHVAATRDRVVQSWVARLLSDNCGFWTRISEKDLADWIDLQTGEVACDAIEWEALALLPVNEVYEVEVHSLEFVRREAGAQLWSFEGAAKCQGASVLREFRSYVRVAGTFHASFDQYGRMATHSLSARAERDR